MAEINSSIPKVATCITPDPIDATSVCHRTVTYPTASAGLPSTVLEILATFAAKK